MQVFFYDREYGRAHGFRPLGIGWVLLFSLGSTLAFVLLLFLCMFLFGLSGWLILLLTVAFITTIIVVSALYARPRSTVLQTGYVRDASGLIWQVILFPQQQVGTTAYQLARRQMGLDMGTQADQFAFYVQSAQQGVYHWNAFWGGEAKVTPLYQLQVINQNKSFYQCTYLTANGAVKKLSLPKAYPSLFYALWGTY